MNLAVPGFGSAAAGRKVGYFQAALMLLGLALSLFFFGRFIAWYIANYSNLQFDEADPLAGLRALWQQIRWPIAGFAVFGVAWVWALITSFQIVVEAKSRERRNVPPVL